MRVESYLVHLYGLQLNGWCTYMALRVMENLGTIVFDQQTHNLRVLQPYAPEQLCSQLVTSTPKRNTDLSSDTTFDHSDVEGAALTSNHGNREDSHMDQALDGSTGGSSGVEPDDAQDGQSTNKGHGQRLSAASDRTEASTASLGGDAFEASEDGLRRSSADTAKCKLASHSLSLCVDIVKCEIASFPLLPSPGILILPQQ